MWLQCAPACRTCEKLDYSIRCEWDLDRYPNIWQTGDLNRMFKNIVSQYANSSDATTTTATTESSPSSSLTPVLTIHSRPSNIDDDNHPHDTPWVIQFDNLLTEEEAQHMIDLGHKMGFSPSVEFFGDTDEFGTTHQKSKADRRTSETVWCQDALCLHDPVPRRLMDRMVSLTGVPEINAEYLQLLKYETNQFYTLHHDASAVWNSRPSGIRILTFFVYLNDVEEGGGTEFPHLNLTVTPKRGRGVLWPSVLNDNVYEIDSRTEHQALPVTKGKKYGINAWFHLRDFRTFNNIACT
jgi:prolyl 4-hydroxylase